MQKSYKSMKKLLVKPLKALASPGIYLFGKYNQYKREREETNSVLTPTENELSQLNCKIDKLLSKLNGKYVEMASSPDEECVICVNAKAVMQTYPCGHKVVCRRCFVKTIQIALAERTLPLRYVICRAKILRLRQTQNSRLQPSRSFYSRGSSSCMPKRSSHSSCSSSSSSSSSYSFKGNPWFAGFKYSKSLPGINGCNSRYKTSVNRSYSTVVYRQSSNPMARRCCRSCSLSSYSWLPIHDGQSTSLKQKSYEYSRITPLRSRPTSVQDNIERDTDTNPSQEMTKNGSLTRSALSRDELIHQFQRDFHEGQLTSNHRSGHLRNKSSTLSTQRQTTPVVDLIKFVTAKSKHHPNLEESRTTEDITTTVRVEKHEEKTTALKIKEKIKPYKLLRLEKKENKILKCRSESTTKDSNKFIKKDKKAEKKIS